MIHLEAPTIDRDGPTHIYVQGPDHIEADRWGVVFELLFEREEQWEAFRYPPDAQPAATELVIRQMETFAEEWSPTSGM